MRWALLNGNKKCWKEEGRGGGSEDDSKMKSKEPLEGDSNSNPIHSMVILSNFPIDIWWIEFKLELALCGSLLFFFPSSSSLFLQTFSSDTQFSSLVWIDVHLTMCIFSASLWCSLRGIRKCETLLVNDPTWNQTVSGPLTLQRRQEGKTSTVFATFARAHINHISARFFSRVSS